MVSKISHLILKKLQCSLFCDGSYGMDFLADTAPKLYVSTGECGVSVEVERMASKVSMWTKSEGWMDGLYNTHQCASYIYIDMYNRIYICTEK